MRGFLWLALLPGALAAQVAIETVPVRPLQGSLFRMRVTATAPAPVFELDGSVAGQRLHFRTDDRVIWESLAAVPVETTDSLDVTLVLRGNAPPDTVHTRIAIGAGDYPHETLRVAPSMAKPDSAAQRRIAQELARARAVSHASHDTPRQWTGPFLRPRPGRITSPFGTAREYNGEVTSRHMGTDFAGAIGAPVYATNAGRVALVARFYLSGNVVYLDHGDGLVSAYFHLSRTLVKAGDVVKPGQRIGNVGATGRVTGPHLHWVMRYGTVTVDPMSVLGLLGEMPDSTK
ncbi:MAG: M23 family metallopeptidase [Gemmatimonadetes bacterium]|nr:M23 family metallopeptidase [Gemmatimonadota bacterium]